MVSVGFKLTEEIKEGIRETSAFEIKPLALSLASDLFSLAKAEART